MARTHGASKHRLYNVWRGMMQRCYNTEYFDYPEWGGRGIKVFDAWREDIWEFIRWAEQNGYRPGLLLDRRDNDGDYSPGNCRFVSAQESACNRRPPRSHVLTPEGLAAVRAGVSKANKERVWTKRQRAESGCLLSVVGKETRFKKGRKGRDTWAGLTLEQRKERMSGRGL